ncbi:LuxR C-terminal-related transcriptional regulator [Streptomyces sp. NPDC020607]|uniref:LuxR C-terminal-related transcriptional regulator n=1 Tax=Streptomyces sp. NPDC020607 TaxID=3365082 RepID=UPI0037B60C6B
MSTVPVIDATGIQILALLRNGLDDAAVARQLGMGHRTVQRKVQDLMSRLGAKGRVALGAQAQQLGLFAETVEISPVVTD